MMTHLTVIFRHHIKLYIELKLNYLLWKKTSRIKDKELLEKERIWTNIYHPTKEKVPVARFTVKITTCKSETTCY